MIFIMEYIWRKEDTVDKPTLFTFWSFVHIVSGIVLYSVLVKYFPENKYNIFIAIILHTIYEIKDYLGSYKYKREDSMPPFYKKCVSLINSSVNIFLPKKTANHFRQGLGRDSLLNSFGDTLAFCLGIYLCIKYNIDLKTTIYMFIGLLLYMKYGPEWVGKD